MRENKNLVNMLLLQRGNRLSVIPLTKTEFDTIVGCENSVKGFWYFLSAISFDIRVFAMNTKVVL